MSEHHKIKMCIIFMGFGRGYTMKVYITKLNGIFYRSKEQYAQHMVADIAHTLGIREMGIYRYNAEGESAENRVRRLDGIIAGISAGDIVVCQFPTWNGLEFERVKAYQSISWPCHHFHP